MVNNKTKTQTGDKMKMGFKWAIHRTEEEKQRIIKKDKGRREKFNPNRAYIDQAVNDYLQKGGTIEKVEPGPDYFEDQNFFDDEIDSFLMGVL